MATAGQIAAAGRIPGEWIGGEAVTADSAVFGTTETEVMSVTVPLGEGRTYDVIADPAFASASDGDLVIWRLREDSAVGTIIQRDYVPIEGGGDAARGFKANLRAHYTATATGDKRFVVTADTIIGSGGLLKADATHPCRIDVYYKSG